VIRPLLLVVTAFALAVITTPQTQVAAPQEAPAPSAPPASEPGYTNIICTCQVACIGTTNFYFGRGRSAVPACANATSQCQATGCATCEVSDLICE
jgi:hypothetical protein